MSPYFSSPCSLAVNHSPCPSALREAAWLKAPATFSTRLLDAALEVAHAVDWPWQTGLGWVNIEKDVLTNWMVSNG